VKNEYDPAVNFAIARLHAIAIQPNGKQITEPMLLIMQDADLERYNEPSFSLQGSNLSAQ